MSAEERLTFAAFCARHDVTAAERQRLVVFLVVLRAFALVRALR